MCNEKNHSYKSKLFSVVIVRESKEYKTITKKKSE